MSKQEFVLLAKPGEPIQVHKTFLKEKNATPIEIIHQSAKEFDYNNLGKKDGSGIKIKSK